MQGALYLGDLQVVELLLPLENGLQPAQPNVDVAHQDTPADVDGQAVQRGAEVVEQLLHKAWVVLVLENWRHGKQKTNSDQKEKTKKGLHRQPSCSTTSTYVIFQAK